MPRGSKLLSLKSSLDSPESSKSHHLVSPSSIQSSLRAGIGHWSFERDVLFWIMYMDPVISQGIPDRASEVS